jgi:hypothetical protein
MRSARIGSASVENLLAGDVTDGSAISRVLAAARAPGTPEEVAGLEAARSTFVLATLASPRPPINIRPALTRTTAVRLLTLKAIAAVSGATLIGGVAYAASNTALLGGSPPNHQPAHQPGWVPDSGAWDPLHQQPTSARTIGKKTDHPTANGTLHNGRGASATAHASHTHPAHPTNSPLTHAPTPTPTHTHPSNNRQTTPAPQPKGSGGPHAADPSPAPSGP